MKNMYSIYPTRLGEGQTIEERYGVTEQEIIDAQKIVLTQIHQVWSNENLEDFTILMKKYFRFLASGYGYDNFTRMDDKIWFRFTTQIDPSGERGYIDIATIYGYHRMPITEAEKEIFIDILNDFNFQWWIDKAYWQQDLETKELFAQEVWEEKEELKRNKLNNNP